MSDLLVRRSHRLIDTESAHLDFEKHPLLASFFDVREAAALHLSFRTKQPQRNHAPRLLEALKRFLDEVDRDLQASEILDALVFDKQREARKQRITKDILRTFKRLNPQGVELLELSNPITFESLKKSYKKASLSHHPDRGGDTSSMQAVNEAYSEFHALLCIQIESQGDEEVSLEHPEERSAEAYVIFARGLQLATHVDLWDVGAALEALNSIADHQAFSFANFELLRGSVLGSVLEVLGDLSKRLAAAGSTGEAEGVLATYERLSQDLIKKWLNSGYYEPHLPHPSRSVVDGSLSTLALALLLEPECHVQHLYQHHP